MIALFKRGSEINHILVSEELKRDDALESVGGLSFVNGLTYGLPRCSNLTP